MSAILRRADDAGATAIEYGLIAAAIAVVIITAAEFDRLTGIEGLTHDEAVLRMVPMAVERLRRGFRDAPVVGTATTLEEFERLLDRDDPE